MAPTRFSLVLSGLLGVALLGYAAPTRAGVCEPDNFSSGDNLSIACSGVTLSASAYGPVTAGSPSSGTASTGSLVFNHSDSNGFVSDWGNFSDQVTFRANFSIAQQSVSIDLIANDPVNVLQSDLGELFAYDSSDNLLGSSASGVLGSGGIFTASFVSGSANIAYIIASGVSTETVNLDNLRFGADAITATPEPASLALLGVGLAGLVAARRRRG